MTSWSKSKIAKNILVFFEFARFYRRFMKEFSQIAALLTNLTRDVKKDKTRFSFAMTKKARNAFEKLKRIFIIAFILQHYDWKIEIRMKTNAFNCETNDVFSQKSKNDQWHSIAFFNYKFKRAKIRWDTYDKELYAIVLSFKNWRHYLQNSKHVINVITNHNNLRYFMTTKKLNARQMRWAEKLVAFDFNIEYRKKKLNFVDASFKRSDIMKSNDSEKNNDDFLSILRNKLRNQKYQFELQRNNRILVVVKLAIAMTQSSDKFIASTRAIRTNEKELERRRNILNFASSQLLIHQIAKSKKFYLKLRESMIAWLLKLQQENVFVTKEKWRQRYASKSKELSKWSMRENELLRRDLAIYVSNDFATKKKILRMNHDDFDANHFARVRIENAIRRKYYWSNMIDDIAEYVRNCSNCQRVRIHHHKSYENLTFISSNDVDSFHTVIMNFITDMSFARNSYIEKINDAILVLIDKLIKYVTYIATIKDLNIERLVDLMWREFICRHDMMRNIISNRDSLFTSHFWSTLCWHLRAKRTSAIWGTGSGSSLCSYRET